MKSGSGKEETDVDNENEEPTLPYSKSIKVWGMKSTDPNNIFQDVKESKRLIVRLKEQKLNEMKQDMVRKSLANEQFKMFREHTRNIERAKQLLRPECIASNRARDDDCWLAIGRALYGK